MLAPIKYLMDENLADHINQDRHIPGIFILNSDLSIGQNIDELILIAECSFENEYQDQIIFLPLTIPINFKGRDFLKIY